MDIDSTQIEALKREVISDANAYNNNYVAGVDECIAATIDYLASRGYLRTPVVGIEGLEDSIKCLLEQRKNTPNNRFENDIEKILDTSHAYLALTKGV